MFSPPCFYFRRYLVNAITNKDNATDNETDFSGFLPLGKKLLSLQRSKFCRFLCGLFCGLFCQKVRICLRSCRRLRSIPRCTICSDLITNFINKIGRHV